MKEYKETLNILSEPEVIYKSLGNSNAYKLIDIVEKGIDYRSFAAMMDKHFFTILEWCQFLNLSERTLQRYKTDRKTFDSTTSEKILKLTMLFKYGEEVFSDKGNFHDWLYEPLIALNGKTPKSLLVTDIGIGLVKNVIGRIEHGVFS